jgi:hypothetical protein
VSLLKLVNAAARVSSDSPEPTATSASVTGIAIATALPRTRRRTRTAAARPSASLVVESAGTPSITWPPNSTRVVGDVPMAFLTPSSSPWI